jgi:hypothetical protein
MSDGISQIDLLALKTFSKNMLRLFSSLVRRKRKEFDFAQKVILEAESLTVV